MNPSIWIVSTLEVDLPLILCMHSGNRQVTRQFQAQTPTFYNSLRTIR